MNLDHLSASSARLFLECPAKWRHHYVDGGKRDGNRAADNGSAIHEALEAFTLQGHHLHPDLDAKKEAICAFYEVAFNRMFGRRPDPTHPEARKAGRKMLTRWVERNHNRTERTILEVEYSGEFTLDTQYGPVKFVYRTDRIDERIADERIIVTDYKSGRWAISADDLKHDIQVRSYAVAAWKKYPGRDRYTVNLDYLALEREIGVIFTVHEIAGIYDELCQIATQILESDGQEERLNSGCRFCPRIGSCEAVRKPLPQAATATMSRKALVDERIEAEYRMGALKTWMAELDAALMPILEDESEPLIQRGSGNEGLTLKGGRGQRRVNGDELMSAMSLKEIVKHGGTVSMSVSTLDTLIKLEVDPDKKAALSRAMGFSPGRPSITVVSVRDLPEE